MRLTDKLVTSIGKQAAAYGGFEYDLDPIEIYQYSDMIDYMLFDFMTGITFSYQVTPTQELALQIVNSRTASMDDIYGQLPGDVEEDVYKRQDLYYHIFLLITEIQRRAFLKIDAARNRKLASQRELNPVSYTHLTGRKSN